MTKKIKTKDPFASREANNYSRPVPSREFLLDFLSESVGPLTHTEICSALELQDEEQMEAMRRRLRAMEARWASCSETEEMVYGTLDKPKFG